MSSEIAADKGSWLERRRELLLAEKEAMRKLDDVSRKRRDLPWIPVSQEYVFSSEQGDQILADLFGPHSQLIVYHFMFGPGWDEGCLGCSFLCDHFDGANRHLKHHNVSLVCVSRAKLDEILPYKRRMGWDFPWVSSTGSSFNFDFGVSFTSEQVETAAPIYNYDSPPLAEEMQGLSVFAKDESGSVCHTYSTFARGLDLLIGAHNLLDLTPRGRNEQGVMNWVRHHDQYGVEAAASFPTDADAHSDQNDGNSCCSESRKN